MNKKLPLVNKALLWKEWTSYKPLIIAFFGFIMFTHPIDLLLRVTRPISDFGADEVYYNVFPLIDRLNMLGGLNYSLITLLFIILFGCALIGEERRKNTYDLLLSMPFSRREIFFTKYLFGVGCIVGVYTIAGLSLSGILAAYADILAHTTYGMTYGMIWGWVGAQVLLWISILSFTFIIASLTGGTVGSAVLSGIFLIFPMGFDILIQGNMYVWGSAWSPIHGVYYSFHRFAERITLPIYINQKMALLSQAHIFIIISLVMFLIALWLFERNPMEKNGELLMFHKLEPVLKVGVTVCFMLLIGGIFAQSYMRQGSTVGMLIGYVIGGLIGWAISYFSLKTGKAGV